MLTANPINPSIGLAWLGGPSNDPHAHALNQPRVEWLTQRAGNAKADPSYLYNAQRALTDEEMAFWNDPVRAMSAYEFRRSQVYLSPAELRRRLHDLGARIDAAKAKHT